MKKIFENLTSLLYAAVIGGTICLAVYDATTLDDPQLHRWHFIAIGWMVIAALHKWRADEKDRLNTYIDHKLRQSMANTQKLIDEQNEAQKARLN